MLSCITVIFGKCREIQTGIDLRREPERMPDISLKMKIWFEFDNAHAFGSGLADLLECIERHGTLRAAAESTEMSYRHAWDLLKSSEKHLGSSLIVRHTGGTGGGGCELSPMGKRLLSVYRGIAGEISEFAQQRFRDLWEST